MDDSRSVNWVRSWRIGAQFPNRFEEEKAVVLGHREVFGFA
ncbi:MAG TPA: hypothetical protein VKA15_01885 [Isosphaeraceae bacterium]|nr:hypothetical protein [Isosphaeraceae bacterium]